MANVYVDLDKSASTEDGTTWANAFRLPSEIVVASGDDVWIKGNTNGHSGGTITFTFGTDAQNPAKIQAVKSATTNAPPVAADLIPGWRTGESRTEANRAYIDADAPLIQNTDSSQMRIVGDAYIYGVQFKVTTGQLQYARTGSTGISYEECLFEHSLLLDHQAAASTSSTRNCGFKTNATGCQFSLAGNVTHIGATYIAGTAATGGYLLADTGTNIFKGCDFVALGTSAIIDIAGAGAGNIRLENCILNSSFATITGTKPDGKYRVELQISDGTTGKSSGSLQNIEIVTESGDINDETTAVRTGGATDGEAGLHSMAMTPDVNGTRDQYKDLLGPWMAFWVTNSDTAVTVYIANSGAADYFDDDAWLEVMDVSNGGTAQHTHFTTQMTLLDTSPNVIADDDSTWGSGGNNPQKFVVTISPDFSGWSYCRVHFAKNFGSSPETLYVDPNPVTS